MKIGNSLPLAFACFALAACANPDADTSTHHVSKAGLYEVSYEPSVQPVPKRALHAWTIQVRDRDGNPVEGAVIKVDGGMPQHGHGLPTTPFMKEALGDGRYLVDGMKFNMGGWWVIDVHVSSSRGEDDVRFELNL